MKPLQPTFFKKKRITLPERLSRGGSFEFNKEQERPLTGKVQNVNAAKGEERLSRTAEKGIKKRILNYYHFRWRTLKQVAFSKELDFLFVLANGRAVLVSVKNADFTHFGTKAKETDKLNEISILRKVRELGFSAEKVETVFDRDLDTQEKADKMGRKLGIYR